MKNKRQDEKVKKKRKNRPCIYRNKTWRDKMKKSLKTDRGRAQREQRDFRNKRCKEKQKTPTVDGTGVRRGSVSLRHLLTDNLTNLSQFFVGVFSVADLHLIWMLSLTHVWWWKCQEISVGGVFASKSVFPECVCVRAGAGLIYLMSSWHSTQTFGFWITPKKSKKFGSKNLTEELSDSLHK